MSFDDQVTSLFSGLVVFSILGFMAHTNGLTVEVWLLILYFQQFAFVQTFVQTLIWLDLLYDMGRHCTVTLTSGNEGGKWTRTCIHCLSRGGHPASCTSGFCFHICIWICKYTCVCKFCGNYQPYDGLSLTGLGGTFLPHADHTCLGQVVYQLHHHCPRPTSLSSKANA